MNRAQRRALARPRQHSDRPQRQKSVPAIVAMHTCGLELHERISVEAIVGGWATTDHFDNLADSHDLLNLASADKGDRQTLAVCEISGIALMNIKDRWSEHGKFGVSGEERKALELLVETSHDFWARQSGTFFADTYRALQKLRGHQKEKREAA